MDTELMKEGYGSHGRPVGLYEGYRDWQRSQVMQESGSTSDFPNYLHLNIVKPKFFEAFAAADSQWRRIAAIQPLPDFKVTSLVGLGELPDFVEILEDDDYMDAALLELAGPSIQLGTFGRTFSLTRKTLVNDEFAKLSQIPTLMGRAARRTLAKQVIGVLTANPNAYDGNPLFDATHGNVGTAALSETTLPTAITAIRTQSNQNGERIGLNPTMLYVPAELQFTAERLLQSTTIPQPGTGLGERNVLQSILTPVVEPYLTDANDWYVFVGNDQEVAPVSVGFLNGKEEPTLMLQTGPELLGSGARDPYELPVDKITWKGRHDWATAANEWRGSFKAIVP